MLRNYKLNCVFFICYTALARLVMSFSKSIRFYENVNIPSQEKSTKTDHNVPTPDLIPEQKQRTTPDSTANLGHNRQRRTSKELCELTSLSSSSSLERRSAEPPHKHVPPQFVSVNPVLSTSVPALPPKPPGPPKLPPALIKSRSSSSLSAPPNFEPKKQSTPSSSRSVHINYPTLPPKARERVKHVGGFECELAEEPPKGIEWRCPICLLVMREPHQVDCCGYSFCKTCIYRAKISKKSCPMCNETEFSVFPNKGLQRVLYEFKVHCSNAKDGCKWIGDLRQLTTHLRGDYYEDQLINNCKYVDVQCQFCSTLFKRHQLQEHKQKLCMKRPYKCPHCNDYSSTFEDVTENHILVCPNIAVLCPYNCGVLTARRDVDKHTRYCGKTEVECEFKEFGCNMKVARKYMQDHILKSTSEHLVLVANSHRELKEKLKDQDSLIEDLKQTVSDQSSEIKALKSMQGSVKRSLSQLRDISSTLPVRVALNNFSKLRAANGVWLSPSFYTHPRGYKMRLQIHIRPNDPGKPGFSMSVYLFLMKGEFDESLRFPLSIAVTVQLLSINPRVDSLRREVVFHDYVSVLCNSRVTQGEIAKEGWGFVISFSDDKRLAFYIQNDSMTFEIMNVRLT